MAQHVKLAVLSDDVAVDTETLVYNKVTNRWDPEVSRTTEFAADIAELKSRSGTSVAGSVATFADLPTNARDGQSYIVRDQVALYTRNNAGQWVGPVPVQGSATAAAVAAAVQTPTVLNALTRTGNRPVGRGEYVLNAMDYGLTADGVTNDSVKMQTAIDAVASIGGGVVFVPPGTYRAYGLSLRDGVRLVGAGKSRTHLHNPANDAAIEAVGTVGAPFNGCEVSDLSITGTHGTASQIGIRFHYVNDGLIARCRVGGMGNNGINYHWSTNGRIIDNDVYECDSFGILYFNSNRMLVSGNYVHDLTSAGDQHFGIQSKASQLSQVIGNRVRNVAGYGLYAFSDGTQEDHGHVFADNIVTDMTTGGSMSAIGIYLNTAHDIRVVNNLVSGTASNGIGTTTTNSVQIIGNRVRDSAAVGISIGADSLIRVSQNIVSNVAVAGVYLNASKRSRVSDNTVTNLTNNSSGLNALINVRGASTLNTISGNDCFDSAVRGIYEEATASYNAFVNNRVGGTTGAALSTFSGSSVQMGNITTLSDNPLLVGGPSGKVGFYGATAVARPSLPADPTPAQIRSALAALGLIGS